MDKIEKFSETWYGALISVAITIAVSLLILLLFLKINKTVFEHLRKRNGSKIHYVFFEKLIKAAIIIFGVISIVTIFVDVSNVWNTILGGTALISGIIAFAAKDTIGDILAGLMISIYKPFSIGDRIQLQDGTVGIVSDITMRHTVLIGVENMRIVVPNSIINSVYITNFSKDMKYQSCYFEFSIGYDSDVDRALEILKQIVENNKYTYPGKLNKDGSYTYGDSYFRRYADSALIVGICVYYGRGEVATEKLTSEINRAVNEAFKEAGIEIPYNYVNVVERKEK